MDHSPHFPAAAAPASRIAQELPPVLYQTYIVNGQQDSSSLFQMHISLSDFMFTTLSAVDQLSNAVSVSIRRFDGRAVEVFKNGAMHVLKLSQEMFAFELDAAERMLVVYIHRKHLPVSSSHSDFPFKLVFVLGVGPRFEVVPTNAFHIGSKQPQGVTKRPPPKRARPPPSKVPFAAPADELDALIENALFPAAPAADSKPVGGVKRGRESPCSVEEPGGSMPECSSPASQPAADGGGSCDNTKRPRSAEGADEEAVLPLCPPPSLSIRLPPPPSAVDREVSAGMLELPSVLPCMGSASSLPPPAGSFTWADATLGQAFGTPSAFLRACSPAAAHL